MVREITARYRRSILGPAWAIVQPVAMMLLFMIANNVLDIDTSGIPYPIFTYSVLIPWMIFSSGVARATGSISSYTFIIKKMAVRREMFPLVSVVSALFDAALASVVLIGLMVYFSIGLTLHALWLPLLLVLLLAFTLGVGLFVSVFGALRDDVKFILPFALQGVLFLSPVIYPVSAVPEKYQGLYALNPMVGILEGFRDTLILGQAPNMELLMISIIATIAVWLVAWPLFRHVSAYFADLY